MFEVNHGDNVLQFEHSLLSLSKWEAKTKKAFMATHAKTTDELVDYLGYMLVTPGVRRDVVLELPVSVHQDLIKYISDPQTATKLQPTDEKVRPGAVTTSETIYSWLALSKIPFQPTETWHINRIMMTINLVQAAQQPPKKRTRAERLADWAGINEQNKKFFKSDG